MRCAWRGSVRRRCGAACFGRFSTSWPCKRFQCVLEGSPNTRWRSKATRKIDTTRIGRESSLPVLRRSLALFAVSAVFGQHVVELAHALTTEHVRCAEHGELLHAAAKSVAVDVDARIRTEGTEKQRSHDHCAVAWLAHFQ